MELSERLYRDLYRIRRVEQEIARVYPSDKILSPVHLSIGQEAIAVAVCSVLRPEDIVFGSYRCHAMYLAKGGDLNRMIAELYGRATGCAGGKAGSMHLIDAGAGVMGASAVVATTIPQAVGYAYALKLRRSSAIVACFFGDGAVEEGVFHEAMNFASLHKVPVLFICENNAYAIHSRQSDRQPTSQICNLVTAHGIRAERFDGMDVFELRERIGQAVDKLRLGDSGPVFFECPCYRWKEHVGPNEDFHVGYRSREEAEPWFESDPVGQLGDRLAIELRTSIEADIEAEIAAAFAFAEASPFPEEEELYTDLYKEA